MFKDKNGTELNIGDYIIPDEGMELLLTEEQYIGTEGCDCLVGTQVVNPQFFSILTQENLSRQWTKVKEGTEHQTISVRSITDPIIEGDEVCEVKVETEPLKEEQYIDKEWEEREKIRVE